MFHLGTADKAFAIIFHKETKCCTKVNERNKIREKLLSSFESINVSILPAPSDDVHNLDLINTSPEFQKSVKELKDVLLGQMSQPRRFGNVIVNSQNANVLLSEFVKQLEDGDIVHVTSVVSQLQRGVVDDARRCFEEGLIKSYKEIDVPVRDGLEELLNRKRDAFLDTFTKITEKIDLETSYRDEAVKYLDHFAERQLDAKRKENQLAIQIRKAEQNAILDTAEKEFRASVERQLEGDWGSRQMQQRFQEREQRLVAEFLSKTCELDWIVKQREKKLQELKTWASERLKKEVEAKRKEEEYVKISNQQEHLFRWVDEFRSNFETAIQSHQQTSSSDLRQVLQRENERLISSFRNSTDGLHRVSQQREAELGKLKSWAAMRLEQKVVEVEKEEQRKKGELVQNFTP